MDTNDRNLTVDLQALGEVWLRLRNVQGALDEVLSDAQTLLHNQLPLGTSSQAKDLNRKFASRAQALNTQLGEASSRMSELARTIGTTAEGYRVQDADVAATFRAL